MSVYKCKTCGAVTPKQDICATLWNSMRGSVISASIVALMKLQNAIYANQNLPRFITTVKVADGRQLRKMKFVTLKLLSNNLWN